MFPRIFRSFGIFGLGCHQGTEGLALVDSLVFVIEGKRSPCTERSPESEKDIRLEIEFGLLHGCHLATKIPTAASWWRRFVGGVRR